MFDSSNPFVHTGHDGLACTEDILAPQHTDLTRGCVTPKQIENLIEISGGDTEMVDGYDDLPEEYQKKVDFALKNGHVPDEDWKGVS